MNTSEYKRIYIRLTIANKAIKEAQHIFEDVSKQASDSQQFLHSVDVTFFELAKLCLDDAYRAVNSYINEQERDRLINNAIVDLETNNEKLENFLHEHCKRLEEKFNTKN